MLENIIDIVRRAGELVRSANDVTAATHEKNGPADLVTEYDLAVQRFLRQELLALLGSQTYDVGYEVGAIEGHAVPLDYTITLILTMEPEEEGASAPFLYFDGSDEATMDGLDKAAGSNGWVRTHYRVDLAFQQEILDLLLAQPYEEIL